MRAAVLTGLLLWGGASASTAPLGEVLDLVPVARTRVWVYAPRLTDRSLAEAVREAALHAPRPLDVRVLTVPFFSVAPDSLVASLALAGVRVFEANVESRDGLLLVDDAVFAARDLGKAGVTTVAVGSPRFAEDTRRWFERVTEAAPRLSKPDAVRRLRRSP